MPRGDSIRQLIGTNWSPDIEVASPDGPELTAGAAVRRSNIRRPAGTGSEDLNPPDESGDSRAGKVGVMPGDSTRRYPQELKRTVAEIAGEHESVWPEMGRVAEPLGVGTAETAHQWHWTGHRRVPTSGASEDIGPYESELGRPGIWLRMDLEKPPSTQMSCPVT